MTQLAEGELDEVVDERIERPVHLVRRAITRDSSGGDWSSTRSTLSDTLPVLVRDRWVLLPLEESMRAASLELLRSFAGSANKTDVPTLHPEDAKRWYKFIIAIHRDKDRVSASEVREELAREKWQPEQAEKLAGRFEFAIDLLAYYDAGR